MKIIITGASRGIGKALTKKFLEEGKEIIGTSTTGNIDYKHEKLRIEKLDLSKEKSIEEFYERIKEEKISILINNAGTLKDLNENKVIIEKLRETIEINLIGTISLTEKLLPQIKDSGKIINISSSAGSISRTNQTYQEGYPAYKISKAALNMYTKTLSIRLKQKDIKVASIHPGWVRTEMGGENADLSSEESAKTIYERIKTLKETGKFWYGQEEMEW